MRSVLILVFYLTGLLYVRLGVITLAVALKMPEIVTPLESMCDGIVIATAALVMYRA